MSKRGPKRKGQKSRKPQNYSPRDRGRRLVSILRGLQCKNPSQTLEECLASHGYTLESFERLGQGNWLTEKQLATKAMAILKSAGYSGTVTDLWKRIYNCQPPATYQAESYEHMSKRDQKRALNASPWVHFALGQTRRPGSHGSNH